MEVIKCEIDGLLEFQPQIFSDERGYFFESFNEQKFRDLTGLSLNFVQDNESLSSKNVLRGLHFQAPPFDQGKLVRVTAGSVIDVAVDIRINSKTYGKWHAVVLSAENKKQFWIPPGFAHGFLSLEENTRFLYKCTNYYHPRSEGTILWNDKKLGINWTNLSPIVSSKDKEGENFITFVSPFI